MTLPVNLGPGVQTAQIPGLELYGALTNAALAPNQSIVNFNQANNANIPLIGAVPNVAGMALTGQNNYPMPNFQSTPMRAYAANADLPGNPTTPWPIPGQEYYPGYGTGIPSGPIPPGGIPGGGAGGGGVPGGGYGNYDPNRPLPSPYDPSGGAGGGTGGGGGGTGGGTGDYGPGTGTDTGDYGPGEGTPVDDTPPVVTDDSQVTEPWNYWKDWEAGLLTNPDTFTYKPISYWSGYTEILPENRVSYTNYFGNRITPEVLQKSLRFTDPSEYEAFSNELAPALKDYMYGGAYGYALGGKKADRDKLRAIVDKYSGDDHFKKKALARYVQILGMTQPLYDTVNLENLSNEEAYLRDGTAAGWARYLGLEMKATDNKASHKKTKERWESLQKWYKGLGGDMDYLNAIYTGVDADLSIPGQTGRSSTYQDSTTGSFFDLGGDILDTVAPGAPFAQPGDLAPMPGDPGSNPPRLPGMGTPNQVNETIRDTWADVMPGQGGIKDITPSLSPELANLSPNEVMHKVSNLKPGYTFGYVNGTVRIFDQNKQEVPYEIAAALPTIPGQATMPAQPSLPVQPNIPSQPSRLLPSTGVGGSISSTVGSGPPLVNLLPGNVWKQINGVWKQVPDPSKLGSSIGGLVPGIGGLF